MRAFNSCSFVKPLPKRPVASTLVYVPAFFVIRSNFRDSMRFALAKTSDSGRHFISLRFVLSTALIWLVILGFYRF